MYKHAAMRHLERCIPLAYEFLPLNLLDVLFAHVVQVDTPKIVEETFVEVLAAKNVEVLRICCVAHIATSLR